MLDVVYPTAASCSASGPRVWFFHLLGFVQRCIALICCRSFFFFKQKIKRDLTKTRLLGFPAVTSEIESVEISNFITSGIE